MAPRRTLSEERNLKRAIDLSLAEAYKADAKKADAKKADAYKAVMPPNGVDLDKILLPANYKNLIPSSMSTSSKTANRKPGSPATRAANRKPGPPATRRGQSQNTVLRNLLPGLVRAPSPSQKQAAKRRRSDKQEMDNFNRAIALSLAPLPKSTKAGKRRSDTAEKQEMDNLNHAIALSLAKVINQANRQRGNGQGVPSSSSNVWGTQGGSSSSSNVRGNGQGVVQYEKLDNPVMVDAPCTQCLVSLACGMGRGYNQMRPRRTYSISEIRRST